jgi:ABC-type transporter MlaC component
MRFAAEIDMFLPLSRRGRASMQTLERAFKFGCILLVWLIDPYAALSDNRPASPASEIKSEPSRTVAEFLDGAFTLFRETDIAPIERRERLRILVQNKMDIPSLALFTTGAPLDKMSLNVQEHLRHALVDYLVTAYSIMMEDCAKISFDTIVEPTRIDGTAVVTTIFHKPGSPPEPVTWHLRPANGFFRIADVIAGGVSLAVTQREVFLSVMRDGGLPQLISKLEAHSQ